MRQTLKSVTHDLRPEFANSGMVNQGGGLCEVWTPGERRGFGRFIRDVVRLALAQGRGKKVYQEAAESAEKED